MINYDVIVTSAGRPHLLKPTLESLFRFLDQRPKSLIIHNDQVFDNFEAIKQVVIDLNLPHQLRVIVTNANPPRRLGMAINWLMANVTSQYVLYSQDDFVTVRPLPIVRALNVMDRHELHHVRFNKRATMEFKDTWAGRWYKQERQFQMDMPSENRSAGDLLGQEVRWSETLTVSDHWYFQLGLWRASEMRKALEFWTANGDRRYRFAVDEPEGMINHYFDLHYGGDPTDCQIRASRQRTFIWGGIGEDRFIRHIGGDPENWAGDHHRSGGVDDAAKAWREIQSYEKGS